MQHIVSLDDSGSPLDMDGFRQWTKNLHAARDRSLLQPTLFEGSEALAPITVPAISYDGDPHRREPPAFAQTSGQHRLKLISRLGSASARPQADGQAWLAQVDDTEQKVIAKIFCPSFQIPEKPSVHDFEDVPRPRQRARTEAQAYSALSCYQGLWIPYFLGIYEIELLHGETADMVLLEYVPGQSLFDWRRPHVLENYADHSESDPDFTHLHKLHTEWLHKITRHVDAMNERGVQHGDLNGFNIILTPGTEDIVIIDFENARFEYLFKDVDVQKAVCGFVCCENHLTKLFDHCWDNGLPYDWWEWWPGLDRVPLSSTTADDRTGPS